MTYKIFIIIAIFPTIAWGINVRNCDNSLRKEFIAPNPYKKSEYICIKKLVCEVQVVDSQNKKKVSQIKKQTIEAQCPALSSSDCPSDSICLEKNGYRITGNTKEEIQNNKKSIDKKGINK